MTKQTLNMLSAMVLLVLTLTLVSATISLSVPSTIVKTDSSFDFTISSNETAVENVSVAISNSNFNLTQNDVTVKSVLVSSTSPQKITVYFNSSTFDFGSSEILSTHSFPLTVTTQAGVKTTASVVFTDKTYCSNGNHGNIKISVEDKKLDNSKAWVWKPKNNVELQINVENNANDDMSGSIEYCLWDGESCVFDGDKSFSVNQDKNKDYKINLSINPSDLNFDIKDYVLYVKAYDDDLWSESTQCDEFNHDVKISTNSNELIVGEDNIALPETINAGDTVTMEVPIYNIGSKDQEDVLVKFYSKPLGVSIMEQTISNLDSGDTAKVSFTFVVPENATSKNYETIFTLYNKDGDVYEYENSDGDSKDAIFSKNIVVTGVSPQVTAVKATVSAELASSAKAGEEVVVKSVISNTGKTAATLSLSALGYNAWADSVKASENSVVLKAGESKEVTFTFKTKAEAAGTNKFSIEVLSGDNFVVSQPVSVEIEKASSFADLFQFGSNWYLWAIGAFNVILVIVIIIVVVRLLKK